MVVEDKLTFFIVDASLFSHYVFKIQIVIFNVHKHICSQENLKLGFTCALRNTLENVVSLITFNSLNLQKLSFQLWCLVVTHQVVELRVDTVALVVPELIQVLILDNWAFYQLYIMFDTVPVVNYKSSVNKILVSSIVESIFFLNVNSNFDSIFVESKLLKLDKFLFSSDVVFNVDQAKFSFVVYKDVSYFYGYDVKPIHKAKDGEKTTHCRMDC